MSKTEFLIDFNRLFWNGIYISETNLSWLSNGWNFIHWLASTKKVVRWMQPKYHLIFPHIVHSTYYINFHQYCVWPIEEQKHLKEFLSNSLNGKQKTNFQHRVAFFLNPTNNLASGSFKWFHSRLYEWFFSHIRLLLKLLDLYCLK